MSVDVKDLLSSLIKINSVNPSLDPQGSGEAPIGRFIESFCRAQRLPCSFGAVDGERSNVLATVPGQGDDRLLFVAHLDTVPATGWRRDPFEAYIAGNRLYGRGSCDTKGSLAAMLAALASIRDRRPHATITVAGSVDEEHRKAGAQALAAMRPRFDAAVVGEPTQLELVVAHKGSARWQIETTGRAAHSSIPENGTNAIYAMGDVLRAIEDLNTSLQARHAPLTGSPSLTATLIEGGSDICTVPATCRVAVDRRLVPGETAAAAVAEVDAILSRVAAGRPGVSVRSLLPALDDPPMSSACSTRLGQVAQQVCARVAGTGALRGVPYGTDGSRLSEAGIPCVVVGPGSIAQAHAIDEFIDIEQLETAVEIYRSIMLEY